MIGVAYAIIGFLMESNGFGATRLRRLQALGSACARGKTVAIGFGGRT